LSACVRTSALGTGRSDTGTQPFLEQGPLAGPERGGVVLAEGDDQGQVALLATAAPRASLSPSLSS